MTEYSGYWLYNEQLELFHPKNGRLNRIREKQIISDEELLNVIRRAKVREEVRSAEAGEDSSASGPDSNLPVEHPEE